MHFGKRKAMGTSASLSVLAACAVAGAAATCHAAPNGSMTAEGYEITVARGAADVYLNSDDVAMLGTDTALIKKGEGRLVITNDLKGAGWDGDILVSKGFLRVYTYNGATVNSTGGGTLGGSAKGTRIVSGATLEIHDMSTSWASQFPNEPLTMSGSGVDGCGALYVTRAGGSTTTMTMFAQSGVVLEGDTVIGYSGSESFNGSIGFRNGRSTGKTFNMNGYSLTFQGTGTCGLYYQDIENPGNIYVNNTGGFNLENNTRLLGDSSHVFQMGPGTRLNMQNNPRTDNGQDNGLDNRTAWTLRTTGAATLTSGATGSNGSMGWNGPVELGGTLTVSPTKYAMTISGAISGTGGINLLHNTRQATTTTLTLSAAANTYTGTTEVNTNTILKVSRLASIPGAAEGRLVVKAGGLVEMSLANDNVYTAQGLFSAYTGTTAKAEWPYDLAHVWVNTGWGKTLSAPICGPGVLQFAQDGLLTLPGAISGAPDFEFKAGPTASGTTVFTGSGEAGTFDVHGGSVVMGTGSAVSTTAGDVYISADYPAVARFTVTNGVTFGGMTENNRASTLGAGHSAKSISSKGRGIFEMFDGSTVTGRFGGSSVSGTRGTSSSSYQDAGALGSWFQHGGTWNMRHGTDTCILGDFRGAYYSQESGEAHMVIDDISTTFRIARDARSYAVWHHRGGSFHTQSMGLQVGANGGSADIIVSGGTFALTNSEFLLCRSISEFAVKGTHNTLSVLDEGTFDYCILSAGAASWRNFGLANLPGSIATVNIGGNGRLKVNRMFKSVTGKINTSTTATLTDNHAFVNFDGGTLVASSYVSPNAYLFMNFSNGTDRVTVYSGGATIDVQYEDMNLGAALEAPTGNGVDSIPIPAGIASLPAWAYTGAPKVTITDPTGVGTGATAFAEYDTLAGRITRFRVTSRGRNYTSPTVTIAKGGYTNTFTTTAVTSPNASGGFTKKGPRTLTVDRVCSYTGETAVAEGTLKLGVANALDSSAAVRVAAGATFDLNGNASSVPVSGTGTVNGDAALASAWTVDAGELVAGNFLDVSGALAMPASGVVTILHPELLANTSYRLARADAISGNAPEVAGMPPTWTIAKRGDSLMLVDRRGTVIVIR